jgi:23S rRNA-/tRNA-specific pseudouridylate synthase
MYISILTVNGDDSLSVHRLQNVMPMGNIHDECIAQQVVAPRPYQILTVGDGDLTLSLALARAYGDQIDLTASTLVPDCSTLISTYPNAAAVLQELENRQVSVWYGVDATQIHQRKSQNGKQAFGSGNVWDLILFHHPHLGIDDSEQHTESLHAQRHHVLLAHYLASAKFCVSKPNGRIHVCLCGTQATTWKLGEAARRQGLRSAFTLEPHQIISQTGFPTSVPMDRLFEPSHMPQGWKVHTPEPGFAAPRRYRNGKTGSRHALGKYGYRHRRTHGEWPTAAGSSSSSTDTDVIGSMHYVFERDAAASTPQIATRSHSSDKNNITMCTICDLRFETAHALQEHLATPALPIPPLSMIVAEQRARPLERNRPHANESPLIQTARDPRSSTQNADAAKQNEAIVSTVTSGKRLRWFIQHCISPSRSKRTCEQLIIDGYIAVNGQVVVDSGRVLQCGMTVTVTERFIQDNSTFVPPLEIVAQWGQDIYVAWKPVSIRTAGTFDVNTLERRFSGQMGRSFQSLTKLDTGCSGLCVLMPRNTISESLEPRLVHTFTALIHGSPPNTWTSGITIDIPLDGMRRWRKRPAEDLVSQLILSEDASLVENRIAKTCAATVHALETTTAEPDGEGLLPPLTTIEIITGTLVSGFCSILSHYFRKQGYAIVGDRFASREYLTLPRAVRNRLKQKICLGCTNVSSYGEGQTASKAVPEKWRVSHWESFCCHGENNRDV